MNNAYKIKTEFAEFYSDDNPANLALQAGFEIEDKVNAVRRKQELMAEAAKIETPAPEAPSAVVTAPEVSAPTTPEVSIPTTPEVSTPTAVSQAPTDSEMTIEPTKSTPKELFAQAVERERGMLTIPDSVAELEELRQKRHARNYAKSLAMGTNEVSKAIALEDKPLIEVTSPIEFLMTGGAASWKIGGAYGLKMFLAASPGEYGITYAAEELAETRPYLGMAAGIGFGLVHGLAAEKAINKVRGVLTSKNSNAITEAIEKTVSMKIERASTGQYDPLTAPPVAKSTGLSEDQTIFNINSSSSANQATRKNYAQIQAEKFKHMAKRVESERASIQVKVEAGDLRSPEVRQVFREVIDLAHKTELTPDEAKTMQILKTEIIKAERESSVVNKTPDLPFSEASSPIVSKRIHNAVRNKVSSDWYGENALETIDGEVTPASMEKAITALRARLVKEGMSIEDAVKKAPDLFKERLAKGMYGADFIDDVNARNQELLNAFKKANPNKKAPLIRLYKQAEEEMLEIYKNGIDEEVAKKLEAVKPDSFEGIKNTYYRGGIDELDPKYMAPPGSIAMRKAVEAGQSRFKAHDYDISDHLVYVEDKHIIRFEPNLSSLPKAEPSNAVSRIFDYDNIKTVGDMRTALGRLYNKYRTSKQQIWPPKGSADMRPKYPAADRLKVETPYFDTTDNKVKTFKALPDDEVEAIAKLYGWDRSMISNVTVTNDKGSFRISAEDILKGREDFQAWQITDPKGVKFNQWWSVESKNLGASEAKLLGQEANVSSKFRKANSGFQQYRKQREEFLRKAMGFPSAEAHKELGKAYEYYNKLDEVAVVRNILAADVKNLKGSPYERQAKKAMILYGDMLSGSNRLGALNDISRNHARAIAYEEIHKYQEGLSPKELAANYDDVVARYADANDVDFEDADLALRQLAEEDEARRVSEYSSMQDWEIESGDSLVPRQDLSVSDQAGVSMQVGTYRNRSALDQLTDAESLKLGQQLNRVEDHFGVRFIDDLYMPAYIGGSGRINIFKLNTMDDMASLLQTHASFRDSSGQMLITSAKRVNPEHDLGIVPYEGFSDESVQLISRTLMDTQAQMGEMASVILTHPDDIMSVLAFDKLRAVNSMLSTQLKTGAPSAESLDVFRSLNFKGKNDRAILKNILKSLDRNYIVGPDGSFDMRMSQALAGQYAMLNTPAQRASAVLRWADIDTHLNMAEHNTKINELRWQAENILKKVCD